MSLQCEVHVHGESSNPIRARRQKTHALTIRFRCTTRHCLAIQTLLHFWHVHAHYHSDTVLTQLSPGTTWSRPENQSNISHQANSSIRKIITTHIPTPLPNHTDSSVYLRPEHLPVGRPRARSLMDTARDLSLTSLLPSRCHYFLALCLFLETPPDSNAQTHRTIRFPP